MELIKSNDDNFRAGGERRDCMTCRFHDSIHAPPPNIQRVEICRLMPPVAVMMTGPRGETGSMSLFPMVAAGVWCYQWEPSKLMDA